MLKNILGGLAALTLIVVLVVLIVQSTSVGENYFTVHATRIGIVDRMQADTDVITQGLRSARKDARAIPDSVNAALVQLDESAAALRKSALDGVADEETQKLFGHYARSVAVFTEHSRTVAEYQNSLADALSRLQTESPRLVKDLRRYRLDAPAQNTFTITLDVIDAATGKMTSGTTQLRNRLEELVTDPQLAATAPGRADNFAALARLVLNEYETTTNALRETNVIALQSASHQLEIALLAANRETVRNAEISRMMLSIFSALLLLGVGFVGVRLHQSYRALNKSNEQLEQINSSLEERVSARTRELSGAYEELKESQVQLVQAEKMSSLGSLVAGISHEINTPLWYLMSNVSTIKERLDDAKALATSATTLVQGVQVGENLKQVLGNGIRSLDALIKDGINEDIEEAHDLIEDCIDGLNDLTEMAQSLKDFSRLDRAPVGQFDVNDGIEKTLRILKNKIKDRVTVTKRFGEVQTLTCSPSQINQIFLNLIGNAADAIEDAGEITITTSEAGDGIRITIADTGCGIEEDVLAKIRDPFFTTKEVGKGTGLGLSIVDKIVKSHHGELSIESTVGEGSVFIVNLPVKPAAQADISDDESESTIEIQALDGNTAPDISAPEPALAPA